MNSTVEEGLLPTGINCTTGRNDTNIKEVVHRATLAMCTLLLFFIFCLGTYGNLIVFSSFFNPAFRKFRTHFDFMILNLSFCDLFICFVTAPMFVVVMFFDSGSSMSEAFCFTFHVTSTGFVTMSLKTVAVIAVHRLRMVLGQQPNASASFLCTLLLTIILWVISFTLAALSAMTKYHRSKICVPLLGLINKDGKAILYAYVIDFTLCVGIVAVSYAMIAQTLRKNARVQRCPVITVVDPTKPNCFVPTEVSAPPLYRKQNCTKRQHIQTHLHAQSQRKASAAITKLDQTINLLPTKDSKAVVTCIMIVLSVVCCLPLGIALMHDALYAQGNFVVYQFELCGFTLVFFRSGLNPFIYSRNNSGLRKKVACCIQFVGLLLCCKQKTRLKAVGDGSLIVKRNKSSHHDTNSAYILSPKAQKKLVDQACGPSNSKDPFSTAGGHKNGNGNSTPINTRIEPYYSIYNSSVTPEESTPTHMLPKRSTLGSSQSYTGMYYHISKTSDFMQNCDSTSEKQIPIPSV
ncbi:probable G-protein coupled receptor 75 [Latimeria chalumnae]|uniref:G protein-coupled receptor 75 n=1 Tax=Latimeria chalumnae TaxID=7897 RepID=H3BGH5_LATCH|nr:PREDICTED: probable G-protein coupled receptor 75 [Latimeria chalumnae]|eukprot:XP_005988978.1 PREDICTED: probable G-protein coupled receptor 75 [Latimeria chalumnae]